MIMTDKIPYIEALSPKSEKVASASKTKQESGLPFDDLLKPSTEGNEAPKASTKINPLNALRARDTSGERKPLKAKPILKTKHLKNTATKNASDSKNSVTADSISKAKTHTKTNEVAAVETTEKVQLAVPKEDLKMKPEISSQTPATPHADEIKNGSTKLQGSKPEGGVAHEDTLAASILAEAQIVNSNPLAKEQSIKRSTEPRPEASNIHPGRVSKEQGIKHSVETRPESQSFKTMTHSNEQPFQRSMEQKADESLKMSRPAIGETESTAKVVESFQKEVISRTPDPGASRSEQPLKTAVNVEQAQVTSDKRASVGTEVEKPQIKSTENPVKNAPKHTITNQPQQPVVKQASRSAENTPHVRERETAPVAPKAQESFKFTQPETPTVQNSKESTSRPVERPIETARESNPLRSQKHQAKQTQSQQAPPVDNKYARSVAPQGGNETPRVTAGENSIPAKQDVSESQPLDKQSEKFQLNELPNHSDVQKRSSEKSRTQRANSGRGLQAEPSKFNPNPRVKSATSVSPDQPVAATRSTANTAPANEAAPEGQAVKADAQQLAVENNFTIPEEQVVGQVRQAKASRPASKPRVGERKINPATRTSPTQHLRSQRSTQMAENYGVEAENTARKPAEFEESSSDILKQQLRDRIEVLKKAQDTMHLSHEQNPNQKLHGNMSIKGTPEAGFIQGNMTAVPHPRANTPLFARSFAAEMVDKIREMSEQKITAKSEFKTSFVVDGGPMGEMNIEFHQESSREQITIYVDSENTKSELQRVLPNIEESMNQRGFSFSDVGVEVKDDHRDSESMKDGSHKNSLEKEDQAAPQEQVVRDDNKQTTKRNYGYNTMEVLA